MSAYLCTCAECTAGRACVAPVAADPNGWAGIAFAPEVVADLQEALRSLVGVVDRIGGWLPSEDQAILWRARRLCR